MLPTSAALRETDAIHASPPCQAYSQAALGQRNAGKEYPDLVGPVRDLLDRTDVPWVMENVPGAPMRPDFKLCGCQFDLNLRRERWFETSWQGFGLTSRSCSRPASTSGRRSASTAVARPGATRSKTGRARTATAGEAATRAQWLRSGRRWASTG
jgi:hypothetical protein